MLKDDTFQPSEPFRHAAELGLTLLHQFTSVHADWVGIPGGTVDVAAMLLRDAIKLKLPSVLVLRTDGGKDHNNTHSKVQMSLLALFLAMGLDMLVAARTCPGASYLNDAEKSMGLLNVALLGVSTERAPMANQLEELAGRHAKMAKKRKRLKGNTEFERAYAKSMQQPISRIKSRMRQLEYNGRAVDVLEPATTGDVASIHGVLHTIVDDEYVAGGDQPTPLVQDFIGRHARQTTYMFCLRRCADAECACNFVRASGSSGRSTVFQHLNAHDPPLPAGFERGKVNGEKHYKHYAALKGKATDEANLPSRNLTKAGVWCLVAGNIASRQRKEKK